MVGGEKQAVTPKEIIHHKFGVKASYRIEEVHVSSQNDCPGLAIPQKVPCLYRCHLHLPEFSVVSNVFKKKKDSEQSAAELALEKLGIQPVDLDDITVEEAWDDIVERIKYIFSDEFLSAGHPLGSHIRASLQRDGESFGSVPISVIATFDSKVNSLCKVINPSVDSDPILAISYVAKAAEKLSDYIVVSPHVAALQRKNPYPPTIIQGLATHVESIKVEAVRIECTRRDEEVVEPVILDISSDRYYLDIIAEKLGLKDGGEVLISRSIGKTSSGYECRVYSAIPKLKSSNDESSHIEKSRNAKASFVCGQDIHGDAILAAVGYPWRSHDLEHDDVTLKSFYRICCGMSPNGIYKISRQALIAAKLPLLFTGKSSWRGPLPREILKMFCRQQQLAEPIFTISQAPVKSMSDLLSSYKKLKVSEWDDTDNQCFTRGKQQIQGTGNGYRCEVKIFSKSQDLVLDCSLKRFYEKENDAVQNASLKALSWVSMFFDDLDVEPQQPCFTEDYLDLQFKKRNRIRETFPSSRVYELPTIIGSGNLSIRTTSIPWEEQRVQSIANGSLVSICYSVSLQVDAEYSKSGKSSKELIESNEEIEFEVGHGSMNPHLESVVTQMHVGQCVRFSAGLPAEGLVLAAANDTVRTRTLLSEFPSLKYSVLLLGVKGPTEERMEEAFFKPPLSKQRVEFALKHIKESSPSTLVDFGCGSGSLLDSLLDYPTSLQTVAGVDISQKGLARASKMLHSKLNKGACNLKSIILYDGSILEFDSRLHDIDIGICLEVIEHMEEDEALQFGVTVLSLFRPKLLIVSTPNYEYNTVLNMSAPGHPKDKSKSHMPKLRNHDHKFEWTRAQFNHWASKLAKRHNYSVEFSGVGGSSNVDPGFASQIAVFRRGSLLSEVNVVEKVPEGSLQPYKVIWEWRRGNGDKKTETWIKNTDQNRL